MTVSDGAYHFTYPDHLSETCRLLLPAFTVLAGETLVLEFDAKTDKEPFWGLGADFLANSNWVTFGFRCEGDATVTNDWKHFVYKGKAGENFRNNMRSGRILFAIGARVGRTVSLRNFKITRMLPADFDMLIRVDPPLFAPDRPGRRTRSRPCSIHPMRRRRSSPARLWTTSPANRC